MSRILLGSAGIWPLAIVLSVVAHPATADTLTNLNGTDGTLSSDSVPIVTSTGDFATVTPNGMDGLSGEGSVPEHYDTYSTIESPFKELGQTIFDTTSSNTEETTHSTYTELVATSDVHTTTQNVYTTTYNIQNTTSYASDVTSQITTSNTTLATLPVAEEKEIDRVRREATSLRIGLIVVGIIAGLGIICSIILVVCLVLTRKQNRFQTEFGIEMKRQNRQSEGDKWPEITRNSSTDDIDSESQISGGETNPNRAPSSAGSSNIYLDPHQPTQGLTSFTPPSNIQNNDHDIYISCDQDNESYNQNAQNNEYYNEDSQDNQVYNNIKDGINQIPPIPRRENVNIRPSDSSEDTGIYSNFTNG